MNFTTWVEADKLADKNGWEKVTGRIYIKRDAKGDVKYFACVIKHDGIVQAFTSQAKEKK